MLDKIVYLLIMTFLLLLFIIFISGIICSCIIHLKCSIRYNTQYVCQAIVDFPVPQEFRKIIWWPWKSWRCYLRQQDDKRFRLFYALTVEGGLLIREYSLIQFVKPKILFFVPGHALSEPPKRIKFSWYLPKRLLP